MYRTLGYFGRAAIYYTRIHNEYSLTTRHQGFNYGVNSTGCAIAEPTEIYQKFGSRFFFFARAKHFERSDYGVNDAK